MRVVLECLHGDERGGRSSGPQRLRGTARGLLRARRGPGPPDHPGPGEPPLDPVRRLLRSGRHPAHSTVLPSGERQWLDQGAHAKVACTHGMERTSMALTNHLQPIPHPPAHLFVGNLFDLDANHPIESMMDLAREYGPIFQIDMPGGNSRVVVSGFELVDELCDESRFDK